MKIAIIAMTGEAPCFAHVMLNSMDMKGRGFDVKVVVEGRATLILRELAEPGKPFSPLYAKFKEAELIDAVCSACAKTMGAFDAVHEQGLPLVDEMSGHPSLGRYLADGYQLITM